MAHLRRMPYTKPIPPDATIVTHKGTPHARFKDKKGKTVLAPLTENGERIRLLSQKWYGEYVDADGAPQCVPLSANKTAAEQMLNERVRRVERIRANVITSAEDKLSQHQPTPLAEHFDAYREHLQSLGVTEKRVKESRHYLDVVAKDCGFCRLPDLSREAFERWLARRTAEGMSARSRNAHRECLVAFCNWCADPTIGRLTHNPFDRIPKADEKADPRRPRRAMNEKELVTLLDMARRRPLLEAMTIRRGGQKGQLGAKVKPAVRERLERIGRERALIYKTLVLTGLRKSELASLTVGQLRLDEVKPYAELYAADEKNREGSLIAIRSDLTADLREWLADKLQRLQDRAQERGEPIPARLPADTPVFNVPRKLYQVLTNDLKAAGIPKRDERGRVLDVHALRTTFGTLLSKGGVNPRTAQSAMRHSTIDLTMNVYTDPKLLDVHAAVEALPALPLRGERQTAAATGTDGNVGPKACAQLAPANDLKRSFVIGGDAPADDGPGAGMDTSPSVDRRRGQLILPDRESRKYLVGESNPGCLVESQTS